MSHPPQSLPDGDDDGRGDDPLDDVAAERPAGAGRPPALTALAVFVAVALAAVVVLGVFLLARAPAGPSAGASLAVPSDTSVEAGFARDMQAHHRQAVTMSLSVLGATDDAEVQQLATDVLLTQQQQAGQMHGWLELWGLPQTGSQPVMAWMARAGDGMSGMSGMSGMHGMDHGGAGPSAGASGVDSMPGMATSDQLARLQAARGTDAERLYLQLMIPHHEAGVEMAQAALELFPESDTAERSLAQAIVSSQTSELAVLHALLDARGGPLPA